MEKWATANQTAVNPHFSLSLRVAQVAVCLFLQETLSLCIVISIFISCSVQANGYSSVAVGESEHWTKVCAARINL